MSAPLRVSDWTSLPLGHASGQGGRCLIEASAGTGKTWTISVLYLRLLLEQALSPRQIVVTTFTDAAAQELRERLRERLRWAERRAQTHAPDAPPAAPDEAWLHARWATDPAVAASDALRLRLAQAELDLAPVGTLHGLCRRILTDFPFECGSAFRLGELVPGDALDDELVEDLWRQLGQSQGDLAPGDLAWWKQGLDRLRHTLRAVMKPGVRVAVAGDEDIETLMQPANARRIRDWLGDEAQFKSKASVLPKALRALADFIEAGDRAAGLPKKVADDLCKPLESQLKPAFVEAAAASEAIALAHRAASVLVAPDLPARSAALARYREVLLARRDERLRERAQLTFDGLIGQVHRALAERGGVLADRLFREWPVALVDEFQDTDQQQYAILDRIYRDDGAAERGRLVMIGDPKQAIYRFRGGDIHAYLAAKKSADAELHLDRNFRSSAALVAGFNELYALAGPALSQHAADIGYEPVSAGRAAAPLLHRGQPVEHPLALHLCRDAPVAKGARVAFALDACANHIAQLLAGDWQIGDKPLRPGDIAVLLPTNHHVALLRKRLQARQVPCVGAGRSSVFATDLARELQIVLYAIEHAGDEGALRAALATRLIGVGLAELAGLRDRPEDWLRHEQRFAHWQRQWRQEGVLAVVQGLLHHAAPALLASPDGERALTDLRHLGELLQQAAEERPGAEQLLAWLAEQRGGGVAASDDAAEEQQLRIESDARRVRLMTLHASKGLEFPVVLLPLMWAQEGREEKLPLSHDPVGGLRELVLGGPAHAAACTEVAQEDQDERFRVLYVALTRAELACHVYLLDPERPANARTKSPPRDPERSALDATAERLLAAGVATKAQHLAWSSDGWPWPHPASAAGPAPLPPPRHALAAPAPRPMQQMHSFSTLARVEPAGALEDQPASDEAPADVPGEPVSAPVAGDPALLALAPWRGAEFGNAMHAVFEHRQVGLPMAQQHAFVARCLQEAGVRRGEESLDTLARRLAARVQATLDAPLAPGLALGALPAQALRAEMAFHYVLDAVSLGALREACARHGEPALVPRGSHEVLRGLMTGKIDLVFQHAGRFHVLDYKSNWLGDSLDAYAPERLGAAMDAHHYRFQALLYTVALDRLLRQRMPGYRREAQLGEAIYLFVRAVGLAPGTGVWRQRFGDALLDAADHALGAPAMEVA